MYTSALDEFEQRFVKPKEGPTLIVGSKIWEGTNKEDRRKRYAEAVGVDLFEGDGVDIVCDLEDHAQVMDKFAAMMLQSNPAAFFAHVECMSVLEHSRKPWKIAENLERLLRPGGSIFVSVPWVWRYHAYDHDYFRISQDGLREIFPNVEWVDLMTASDVLSENQKVAKTKVGSHPYLSRAETVGFGIRK